MGLMREPHLKPTTPGFRICISTPFFLSLPVWYVPLFAADCSLSLERVGRTLESEGRYERGHGGDWGDWSLSSIYNETLASLSLSLSRESSLPCT
jgi:hypothetical protein